MLRLFRRFEQFGRVCLHIAVEHQKAVELSDTTQYPSQRPSTYPEVAHGCCKVLYIFQLRLLWCFLLIGKKLQQLVHIAYVGIERIWRIAFLQLQVTLIFANKIRRCFLARFHIIVYFCRDSAPMGAKISNFCVI